jgi:DNA-directed RNA polymerase subunit M/transcription elongation factor TFIIS
MDFCSQCGAILKSKKEGIFTCACGNEQAPQLRTVNEKMGTIKEIEVVERNNSLATYDHVCSKCGFEKAQVITKGIMISDEDEYIAFICGHCGHHDKADGMKVT